MHIQRNGSRPSNKGPEENFTGSVRTDTPFQPPEGGRASGAIVTFEPGARSAWHTHPLGQTLIILSGMGWTQCEGGAVEEVRPGDVVTCPPRIRHWHGATRTTAMAHVAIAEAVDGKVVDWMEHVTDEDYLAFEKQAR